MGIIWKNVDAIFFRELNVSTELQSPAYPS